jgi:hypothetical protein
MRTPYGQECRYFYGDYFRGRNHEECRLFDASLPNQHWTPDLCRTCPVPEILLANACLYMEIKGIITRTFPFLNRRVQVKAYCTKTLRNVPEPHIGCGECHPLPEIFGGKTGDANPST